MTGHERFRVSDGVFHAGYESGSTFRSTLTRIETDLTWRVRKNHENSHMLDFVRPISKILIIPDMPCSQF